VGRTTLRLGLDLDQGRALLLELFVEHLLILRGDFSLLRQIVDGALRDIEGPEFFLDRQRRLTFAQMKLALVITRERGILACDMRSVERRLLGLLLADDVDLNARRERVPLGLEVVAGGGDCNLVGPRLVAKLEARRPVVREDRVALIVDEATVAPQSPEVL